MRRVLSMWQPWATLCVAPVFGSDQPPKRHETRAFPPRVAVPIDVVIHATKRWDFENAYTASDPLFRRILRECGYLAGPTKGRLGVLTDTKLRPLPMGAIIGVATIAAVTSLTAILDSREMGMYDFELGDWSDGRYAWRLENTALLREPIPFKGRQDVLYQLDPTVERQVEEQLAGATI